MKTSSMRYLAGAFFLFLSLLMGGCGCPETRQGPLPPTDLRASAQVKAVSLSWQASPSSFVSGYNIYYSQTSGGPYMSMGASAQTSHLCQGLITDTTFYFVVRAVGNGMESINSNEASARPIMPPPPAPPQPPTALTAISGNTMVTLTWQASSGATGYKIYIGSPDCSTFISTTTTSGTAMQITGLTNDTAYCFVVRAYNASGESDDSNQATATPTAAAPMAPTLWTAAPSLASVTLTWTAGLGPPPAGYRIYMGTSSGNYSYLTSTTGTIFTPVGLTPGTTFYFVVTAVNASGESAFSNELSATTLGTCAPAGTNHLLISSASPSPGTVLTTTSSYTFQISATYTLLDPSGYVDIVIRNSSGLTIASASQSVSGGNGAVSFTLTSVTPPAGSTWIHAGLILRDSTGTPVATDFWTGFSDLVFYPVGSSHYVHITSSSPSDGETLFAGPATIQVTVSYNFLYTDDIIFAIYDPSFGFLNGSLTSINPGSGTVTLSLPVDIPSTSRLVFAAVGTWNPLQLLDFVTFPVMDMTVDLSLYGSFVLDFPPGGDDDGMAGSGETLDLVIGLRNLGGVNASGTQGVLSSAFTGITINTLGSTPFGEIAPGCVGAGSFNVTIAGWVLNGTIIPFTLQVTANGGSYITTVTFSITVFKKTPGVNILLVDDDESPNNGGFWPATEAVYASSFTAAGYAYDFITVPVGSPGPSSSLMGQYITVVWFAGYSGSDFVPQNEILSPSDQSNLITFLDMGGKKLFISAQFLLMDILGSDNHFAPINNTFVNDHLNIGSYGDFSTASSILGSAGTIGNGMNLPLGGTPTSLWIHTFSPTASGTECFYDPARTPRSFGIQNTGIGLAGTSKTIFLAFPFENIIDGANPNNKATLINRIMNY